MGNTDDKASKLDSYFVNDFNVTYEIKPKSIFKSIVLSGLVNNVFNKEICFKRSRLWIPGVANYLRCWILSTSNYQFFNWSYIKILITNNNSITR